MPEPGFPVHARSEEPGVLRLRVRIPEDHACFAGHFPHVPVLPGIAHLALVDQALRAFLGDRVRLSALPSLRLRHPVRPGEILDVLLRVPADGGSVRFELRRAEDVVSAGTLVMGEQDRDR